MLCVNQSNVKNGCESLVCWKMLSFKTDLSPTYRYKLHKYSVYSGPVDQVGSSHMKIIYIIYNIYFSLCFHLFCPSFFFFLDKPWKWADPRHFQVNAKSAYLLSCPVRRLAWVFGALRPFCTELCVQPCHSTQSDAVRMQLSCLWHAHLKSHAAEFDWYVMGCHRERLF